jgi:hypothetical protein
VPVLPRPLAAFFESGARKRWARHDVLFRAGDALATVS